MRYPYTWLSASPVCKCGVDIPLDVEFGDPGFLAEHAPNHALDVIGGVGGDETLVLGAFLEGSVVLSLESGVGVFGVDVVADANELLVVVGAGEEDDGDADEVAGGYAGR